MTARPRERPRAPAEADPLVQVAASKMRGVLGDTQVAHDAVLVGDYERDRAACVEAVRRAQQALDEAGEGSDDKERAYDLAWAWKELDEALVHLAHVEARARLARRREELKA